MVDKPEKAVDERAPETAEQAELRALDRKIAEAEERKAAAAAARDLRHRRARAERAVKEAEYTETLAELEDQHGLEGVDIAKYVTPDGMVVVKRLTHATLLQRFRNSKKKDADIENFIRPHVIYPAKPAYDAFIELAPAARDPICNLITELYGIKEQEDAGK